MTVNGSEALENIKSIELRHVEHEQDEGIDGEWVYEDTEVYDGTVAENYPDEIEALEKEHKAIEILKRNPIVIDFRIILRSDDYDEYLTRMGNYLFDDETYIATEEEFKSLKEVLR